MFNVLQKTSSRSLFVNQPIQDISRIMPLFIPFQSQFTVDRIERASPLCKMMKQYDLLKKFSEPYSPPIYKLGFVGLVCNLVEPLAFQFTLCYYNKTQKKRRSRRLLTTVTTLTVCVRLCPSVCVCPPRPRRTFHLSWSRRCSANDSAARSERAFQELRPPTLPAAESTILYYPLV